MGSASPEQPNGSNGSRGVRPNARPTDRTTTHAAARTTTRTTARPTTHAAARTNARPTNRTTTHAAARTIDRTTARTRSSAGGVAVQTRPAPNRLPVIIALVTIALILGAVGFVVFQNNSTQRDVDDRAMLAVSEKIISDLEMEPKTLTFLAVGDIVAHKEMIAQSLLPDGSYDFNHVFEPVLERLAPYDLLSVTQETPLVTDGARVGGYPVFGTPVQMGDAIVNAGFDIVVSATNHSLDQGIDGVFDTVGYWRENHPEITLLGLHDDPAKANGVTFIERNDIKIAMTDLSYGLNGFELPEGQEYAVDMLYDLDEIARNVEAAQAEADFTICYVHMGEEYATVPSDEQREVAERLIDAGADVVIGSHVHVVQPMEEVTTAAGNTGIVYFSLGNFASNQADVENMLGGAAVLTITKAPDADGKFKTSVTDHSFVPMFCHYDYETTKMYFLDDYNDELASGHFITLYGHPFTVDQVNGIWTDITGLPRA